MQNEKFYGQSIGGVMHTFKQGFLSELTLRFQCSRQHATNTIHSYCVKYDMQGRISVSCFQAIVNDEIVNFVTIKLK